jgi:uncharacterized protein YcfJ
MNVVLKTALTAAGLAFATQAAADVVFFEGEGFQGRSFTTQKQVRDFERAGFNDRASSVVVVGDRWEACENARFEGRCVVLRPGRYPSLAAMGLNDRVSSVRTVGHDAHVADNRYAPYAPYPVYDSRRRNKERVYEADVTSVRAVVGEPQQRCWVEREQVSQQHSGGANIGGAVLGGIIGGVLGHQVGSGRGNDAATAGGAIAGAAIGANVNRNHGQQSSYQDVRRCDTIPSSDPTYWDVTYNFRGQEHRMQMTSPPGPTVTVNEQGEPRA